MSIHSIYNKVATFGITCLLVGACSHQSAEVAPTVAPEVPAQAANQDQQRAGKTYAPADLELTTSGQTGVVDVVLTVTATADLPNAHARVVVPDGVTLVSATREADLGPLAKGTQGRLTVRVRIPYEGRYTFAGGVEVKVGPGRQLAKAVTTEVGAGPREEPAKTRVIQLPEGGSVRVGE